VDQSAEEVVSFDGRCGWWVASAHRFRRQERKRSMRALAVVMGQIGVEHVLEVATADDQQPVEAFGSDGGTNRSA
jgi:hypothetical protein